MRAGSGSLTARQLQAQGRAGAQRPLPAPARPLGERVAPPPSAPRRARRARGARHRRRARPRGPRLGPGRAAPHPRPRPGAALAGSALALGGLLLAAAALLISAPVWSAHWNAAAQRQAALSFADALAEQAGGALGSVAAAAPAPAQPAPPPDAAPPLPPPVWPFLQPSLAAPAAAAPVPEAAGPVPAGQVLARLLIPAIGVDSYVLEGLTLQGSGSDALLRRGPAHLAGSALPGESGNVVILGHLNVWGSVFLHLGRLSAGDSVLLETAGQTYAYRVTGREVVAPGDVSALEPHAGAPTLQLATCAGLFDAQRLIVSAALVPSAPAPQAAGPAQALVQRYEDDLAAGRFAAAYGLLSPAWQAETSPGALAAAGGPVRAAVTGGWSLGGGEAEIVVREQGALAASGSRVVAYVAGAAELLSSRIVRFTPPLRFAAPDLQAPEAAVRGQALCGAYRVGWQVGPVQDASSAGFDFQERPSQLEVTAPGGAAVGGLEIPGLALGTYPVACGDLTGDGSESLVVVTALPEAGDAEVSVYGLGAQTAALIGQMSSSGGGGYPVLEQPEPDGPYALAVGDGPGSEAWWTFSSGAYRPSPAPGA